MRQAGGEAGPDRVDPYPHDGCSAGGCADGSRDWIGTNNDHVRVAAGDLASEIRVTLGAPLAGIPLDDQVSSLNIAEPTQLFEKRLVEAAKQRVATGFADAGNGTRGDDDRDPVLLRYLLRPQRLRGGSEQ